MVRIVFACPVGASKYMWLAILPAQIKAVRWLVFLAQKETSVHVSQKLFQIATWIAVLGSKVHLLKSST